MQLMSCCTHGTNCDLLKEAAMKFIDEHGQDVFASDSYQRLDESPDLRKEVTMAVFAEVQNSSKRKHEVIRV